MRPIEVKADMEFLQALRCVGYRIPEAAKFKGDGFLLALSLRYGLMGVAAAHHLLGTADPDEEPFVIETIIAWPQMVERHARFEVCHRLPSGDLRDLPEFIARWAKRPVQHSVPLFRTFDSLEACLSMALQDFMNEHSPSIREPYKWWQRRTATAQFLRDGFSSIRYALNFVERRRFGLQEVAEIALLDE